MALKTFKSLLGGEWDRWYFGTLWQRVCQMICSNPGGVKIFVLNSRRLVDLVMKLKIKQLIDGERDNCCCWWLILKLFVAKRSAADIVSLVARRSAIIHWHDEVCGVACRLAWSLTCEAAHVSGGVWHNLTQATYFPREIPFQSVSMKRWFLVN